MNASAIIPAACVLIAFGYVIKTYVLTRRAPEPPPTRVLRHVPMTERELARLRWPWRVRDDELPWPPTTVESFAEFVKLFGSVPLFPRETSGERNLRERVERKRAAIADGWAEAFHLADAMVPGGVA